MQAPLGRCRLSLYTCRRRGLPRRCPELQCRLPSRSLSLFMPLLANGTSGPSLPRRTARSWERPNKKTYLPGAHVRRLEALGPLGDVELDDLTLLQGPETVHRNSGVVDKNVLPTLLRDEAKALRIVEP